LEEAPPILREAIEEARACGAHDVERMALHDLGIATGMLGDGQQSLALVEESLALARAADDRLLLSRCFINVPAIMYANGERKERVLSLSREGLDRSRRSMDHATTSWIARNIGDFLAFEGSLDEALVYTEEAIGAARAVGEVGKVADTLGLRAVIRFAKGDREGAQAAIAESRRATRTFEPQEAIYHTLFDAVFLWTDDAPAAFRSLSEELHSTAVAPATLLDAGLIAARMALRIGDAAGLERSVSLFMDVAARCSGPVRVLQVRWMDALRGEDREAGAATLRAIAREFEEIGYRLPAADCHADAALLAERASLDPAPDLADARRLYAACGAVPILQEIRQPA